MAVPTDNPAVQDFAAATNADFFQQCLVQDQNRDAIDLTGATLTMTLKEDLSEAAILTLSSAGATANGSETSITSALEGAFEITINKLDFASLPFGDRAAIGAFYDIVYTKAGAETLRLVRGQFSISKGVS